jgi:hypothetical protein
MGMANAPKVAESVTLKLFADFHQIHLLDDGANPDFGDAWTTQAVEDRLAVPQGGIGIGTQEAETVSVVVGVYAAEPPIPNGADQVGEGSLEIRSGKLVVLGCSDYLPNAARIPVAPGWYRARVCHTGLGKKEELAVALWPGPKAAPRVVKRWGAPPAVKAIRQTKIENAKEAAQAARRGRLEEAVPVLVRLADSGDGAATASLAEILAYQGKWADFVWRAEAFFVDPWAVYAGNVFSNLTRVFRRAALELRTPEIIERAAAKVPEKYKRMAQATLLKDTVVPSARIVEPTEKDCETFDAAVATVSTGNRFTGHPKELARHCFALASRYHVEREIHRLWNEIGEELQFDNALTVARWHMFRQKQLEAWNVIETTMARWFPVDFAQVAPVELLVDPLLAPLLTPERCAWVLSQPKGQE